MGSRRSRSRAWPHPGRGGRETETEREEGRERHPEQPGAGRVAAPSRGGAQTTEARRPRAAVRRAQAAVRLPSAHSPRPPRAASGCETARRTAAGALTWLMSLYVSMSETLSLRTGASNACEAGGGRPPPPPPPRARRCAALAPASLLHPAQREEPARRRRQRWRLRRPAARSRPACSQAAWKRPPARWPPCGSPANPMRCRELGRARGTNGRSGCVCQICATVPCSSR